MYIKLDAGWNPFKYNNYFFPTLQLHFQVEVHNLQKEDIINQFVNRVLASNT